MAENNQKALEMIQRLRMGIGKEKSSQKIPQKNVAPKFIEDFKIPSLNDIEAPTQSVAEMFEQIKRQEAHHLSGGAKADFAQTEAVQPTDTQSESSLKSISDDLLAQMSPQQKENWQKLGDFIDNWVAENQAK